MYEPSFDDRSERYERAKFFMHTEQRITAAEAHALGVVGESSIPTPSSTGLRPWPGTSLPTPTWPSSSAAKS